MTTPFLPNPIFYDSRAPSGQLFTYIANTTTPQVTYSDAAGSVPNTNPVILDTSGAAIVRLGAGLAYDFVLKDQSGTTTIDTINNYTQPLYSFTVTAALVGAALYPQTAAELASSVTPTNLVYPAGVVDRYGTNTAPGTTDMGVALNLAIKQMLAGGSAVRFLAGAYYIQTAPVFSVGGTTNIVPIDIGGAGDVLTQLISGVATGAHTAIQGGLFNMAALNGWYLHDFLMCGSNTNLVSAASTGAGIVVNTVGGAESIEWRIERITALMAGHGIVCADTNTATIKDFRSWPGNNPTLLIPQTVSNANRGHGVYLTGSFAHNISMINLTTPANANYFSAVQRGIKCDASFSFGCSILMPLVQTGSGANSETGIEWNAGTTEGLSIISPYNEGTIISLKNLQNSEVIGATDGITAGSIVLASAAQFNRFSACNQATITISDNTCFGNKFHNCNARSSFTDSNEAANSSTVPNSFEACNLWNGSAQVSTGTLGLNWRKILTYTASMSLDMYGQNHYVVRANNTSAMAFALAHKRNGQIIEVTIRNENASSALGAITWTSIATPASVPSPAAGFNRTYWIEYDSDFALGYMINWSPADVAN